MSTYTLYWADSSKPPIVIPDQTIDLSSTSFKLYGRGARSYGEGTQENLLRLLENFAYNIPPLHPTAGQMWFNTVDGTYTRGLKVWDDQIGPTGDWTTPSNLDMSAIQSLINAKASKAGDTMTGFLTLNADPVSNLQAATKQYVDTKQPALGFTPVNKAGDIMTGLLTLSGDPTTNLQAATKQYVDLHTSNYVLPISTGSVLGGVKVGSNITESGDGTISLTSTNVISALGFTPGPVYTYTLPIASSSVLGGIKVGTGLSVDPSGILSATSTTQDFLDIYTTIYNFKTADPGTVAPTPVILPHTPPANGIYTTYTLSGTTYTYYLLFFDGFISRGNYGVNLMYKPYTTWVSAGLAQIDLINYSSKKTLTIQLDVTFILSTDDTAVMKVYAGSTLIDSITSSVSGQTWRILSRTYTRTIPPSSEQTFGVSATITSGTNDSGADIVGIPVLTASYVSLI
jgi:hypothetical protein